eukprot:PhF_6_TR13539/c0_g1_i2/m.21641
MSVEPTSPSMISPHEENVLWEEMSDVSAFVEPPSKVEFAPQASRNKTLNEPNNNETINVPFPTPPDTSRIEFHVAQQHEFDLNTLEEIKDFQSPKPWYMFVIDLLGQTYVLFNGVITIMGLSWAYLKTVTDGSNVGYIMYIAVYGPLAFLVMIILVFHNFFSEMAYYEYLKRGAMVSFPMSGSPKYWVTMKMPFAFLFILLAYVGFMLWYFGSTGASFPTYYVFLSNIVIGIVLFWVKHQSIDSRFLPLGTYIQCYPNSLGVQQDTIDAANLSKASDSLRHTTLVISEEAPYTNDFTTWFVLFMEWGRWVPWALRIVLIGSIFAVAAIALSLFQSDLQAAEEKSWKDLVNPCISVCYSVLGNVVNCTCITLCKRATQQQGNTACFFSGVI